MVSISCPSSSIQGLHIYEILSPTRFTCSLMPFGAVGILEIVKEEAEERDNPCFLYDAIMSKLPPSPSPKNLKKDMEKRRITSSMPVTVLFQKQGPLPAHQVEWSTEKRCFTVKGLNKMVGDEIDILPPTTNHGCKTS